MISGKLSALLCVSLLLMNSPIYFVNAYKQTNDFIYVVSDNFAGFTPWDAYSHSSKQLMATVFAGLYSRTSIEESLDEFVPDLAIDFPLYLENGKTLDITLRDNIKFSDGRIITVEDVIYSFQLSLSPSINKISYKYYLGHFGSNESISRLDERTIRFQLKKPFVDTLNLLSQKIVPKNHYVNFINNNSSTFVDKGLMIGSGPYQIDSIDIEKQSISMLKNQFYWNSKNIFTEHITYLHISKVDLYSADVKFNLLDPLFMFNRTEISELNFSGYLKSSKYLSFPSLVYNHNHNIFGNGNSSQDSTRTLNIRKAINGILFNEFSFLESLSYRYHPLRNLFVSQLTNYYNINPDGSDRSILIAKSFMEKAGYDFITLGENDSLGNYNKFFFNVSISASPDEISVMNANYYTSRFPMIGIGVDQVKILNDSEFNTIKNGINSSMLFNEGGFDLLFMSLDWDLNFNPSGYFDNTSNYQHSSNFVNYENFEYNNFISNYNIAYQHEKKVEYLRLIMSHVRDNIVVSPLYQIEIETYAFGYGFGDDFDLTFFMYHSPEWVKLARNNTADFPEQTSTDPKFLGQNPILTLGLIIGVILLGRRVNIRREDNLLEDFRTF